MNWSGKRIAACRSRAFIAFWRQCFVSGKPAHLLGERNCACRAFSIPGMLSMKAGYSAPSRHHWDRRRGGTRE